MNKDHKISKVFDSTIVMNICLFRVNNRNKSRIAQLAMWRSRVFNLVHLDPG